MKFLVLLAVLVASTGVLGQNPYEYVDDALIQRVGQIIYEYDQKQAVGRSSGSSNNFNSGSSNVYPEYPQEAVPAATPVRSANYAPQQQPQIRSQKQFNNVQRPVQSRVQEQPQRVQRQYNNAQPRVQPQQQQNFRSQRQFAAPAPAMYQEPQVPQQKTGFSGYTLSEPEVVARVAEFHFTDGEGEQGAQGSYGNGNSNNYRRY